MIQKGDKSIEKQIFFMPLGGGQRIGASCYYLRIGKTNIILDAGIGIKDGVKFEPDFHTLMTSPFIQSMNQINQIYISHAHLDHVGYLLQLMKQANKATVYMTEVTKVLTEFQLYDRFYLKGKARDEDIRLATKYLLDEMATVSYMQTIFFKNFKVTFYPAGHIPGAMMVLIDTGWKKILYTGDYSLESTLLTNGCLLPKNMMIDTVIMCGLHAKHSDYTKRTDSLYKIVKSLLNRVTAYKQSIRCYVPQLSKGVEFLEALNRWNDVQVPIYLDETILNMVRKMEQLSIPICNQTNKIMTNTIPNEPHIYLTSRQTSPDYHFYQDKHIDFSLHSDFLELKEFIKRINPKQVVLVHCAKEHSIYEHTIEQELLLDSECRTQFIFAEEKELYQL